jgi:hypothetical protein
MTTKQTVLDRLKQGPLTDGQALVELGITKVSSIIARLRQDGHDIKQRKIKSSFGRTAAEWYL